MKRSIMQRGITWSMQRYTLLYSLLPDKQYLKLRYWAFFGKKLDLKSPKTFNEKLQWLKLYDRRLEYSIMVDKYEAKEYVKSIIGDEYIIPSIGVWDSFDEIDFDKLPNQFVLKCTHDSGGLVIVKDKKHFDKVLAKKKINSSLSNNYYLYGREWPYKDIKPRIIVEKYMEDPGCNGELTDYKLMCFNGKVEYIFVCTDRYSDDGVKIDIFDKNWNHIQLERKHRNSGCTIKRPHCFDEMVRLAEKLSNDIPFLRVDFYEIENKVYFGELTFFPEGGFGEFNPPDWDYKFGELIDLT